MKNLLETNVYDVGETMIIAGTCLKYMQPKAYEELEKMPGEIYEVCLEATHVNMVITKLIGMLSRVNIKKVIFASVDKSPHCIQLHYIESEITKAMPHLKTEFVHYVALDKELKEIDEKTIKMSKNLGGLQVLLKE